MPGLGGFVRAIKRPIDKAKDGCGDGAVNRRLPQISAREGVRGFQNSTEENLAELTRADGQQRALRANQAQNQQKRENRSR